MPQTLLGERPVARLFHELVASTRRSANSVAVSWISSPSSVTTCPARSMTSPSSSIRSGLGRRPHPCREAGQQLSRAERLGHIVIRAASERRDLPLVVGDRRQHDDRPLQVAAQPAKDLDPVEVWQRQLQDGRPWPLTSRGLERIAAGGGDHRLVAGRTQDHPQCPPRLQAWITHEHPLGSHPSIRELSACANGASTRAVRDVSTATMTTKPTR